MPSFLSSCTLAKNYKKTYKAMEKVFKSGKARAIGISNFSRKELERLLKETTVVPAAHQLELHPWLQQKEFVEFNKSKGIHISQYSPSVYLHCSLAFRFLTKTQIWQSKRDL